MYSKHKVGKDKFIHLYHPLIVIFAQIFLAKTLFKADNMIYDVTVGSSAARKKTPDLRQLDLPPPKTTSPQCKYYATHIRV